MSSPSTCSPCSQPSHPTISIFHLTYPYDTHFKKRKTYWVVVQEHVHLVLNQAVQQLIMHIKIVVGHIVVLALLILCEAW